MNLPMAPTLPMAPSGPAALSAEEIAGLQEEVRALARERGAVILAHNYQVPEVQDVADYIGDSLGLSRKAAAADGETILDEFTVCAIPGAAAGCLLITRVTQPRSCDRRSGLVRIAANNRELSELS